MSSKRSRAAFETGQSKQKSKYEIYGALGPPPDPDTIIPQREVPVWKQEVTDEQGRKRLHGAFTGGFSAGYYNTVGSKDGWAPSSFVSSRSQRYKDSEDAKRQKPEDFMDEDDLAEQEGTEMLQEEGEFAGLSERKAPGELPAEELSDTGAKGTSKRTKKARPKAAFGVGVLNDTGSDDEDPYALGPQLSYRRPAGKNKKSKKPSKNSTSGNLEDESLAASGRNGDDSSPVQTSKLNEKQSAENVDRENESTTAVLPKSAPPPPKSVFDFITPDARARLVAATKKTDLPVAKSEAPPPKISSDHDANIDLPALDAVLAQRALLQDWTPYANDLSKAARYTAFLSYRAELPDAIIPTRTAFQSHSAFIAELSEFVNSAKMFQPKTGFMASRFTSSTKSSSAGAENVNNGGTRNPKEQIKHSAEEAARAGMYGLLTRTVKGFEPTRLLCKRFNIKPPEGPPESRDIGPMEVDPISEEPKPHIEIADSSDTQSISPAVLEGSPVTKQISKQKNPVSDEESEAKIQTAGQLAFKAVFGSDSEDE